MYVLTIGILTAIAIAAMAIVQFALPIMIVSHAMAPAAFGG